MKVMKSGSVRRSLVLTLASVLTVVFATAVAPLPAAAVRVATYNVLNFPGSTGSARESDFRTVLAQVQPDVLVVQEMLSQAGVNQFLNNVLNYGAPGTYAAGPFVDGPDTDNALFYRTSTIEFVSSQQIPTALRNISEYVVRPVGYSSSEAELTIYSMHLKAGSTSSDEAKRLAETTILRNHMNALPGGSHMLVGGDYNIRGSDEDSYQKLTGSEADNSGRVKDPLNAPGYWHDSATFAWLHTQSPRTDSFGGGATGGMDDRFDLLLESYSLDDGEGLSCIPGTYTSYGNDGYHLNMSINAGTNYAVSSTVADALHDASDHLPVYADFQVPALISAPTSMNFGDVIAGTSAARSMVVENIAQPPADELDYQILVPTGFSCDAGPFEVAAGQSDERLVTMVTSSPGTRSATLGISSDDVDHPTWYVSLSGRALAPSRPSLAEASIVSADTLDFGEHAPGEFSPADVQVYNVDASDLQALLDVYDAEISGSSRFAFAGGFEPFEVGTSPATRQIVFDDEGATSGTLYTAVLTLYCRDDVNVAGWSERGTLTVSLSAHVLDGTSVDEATTFSLSLKSANPTSGEAVLALNLPSAGRASVSVYDVTGRLVARLVDGVLPAGAHAVAWSGKDDTGAACASGVYLVRASSRDEFASAKIVLVR